MRGHLLPLLFALLALGCSGGSAGGPSSVDEQQLSSRRALDEGVLEALSQAGSDLTRPHMIEHHFICDTAEQAQPIVDWGSENGFESSSITKVQEGGKTYVYFDLIKATVPTIEIVSADTARMLDQAARHGAEYDGWGCPVVK